MLMATSKDRNPRSQELHGDRPWIPKHLASSISTGYDSKGFPHSSVAKESTYNAGDPGLILDWEDPLEKG